MVNPPGEEGQRRFRVLVTGSRTWRNVSVVYEALNTLMVEHRTLLIIHGNAPEGADKMADNWRQAVWHAGADVMVQRVPAKWRVNGSFDWAAGFKRNAEMVALAPDVCLAFIAECSKPSCSGRKPHGTHGASHCAGLAEDASIDTRHYGFGQAPKESADG